MKPIHALAAAVVIGALQGCAPIVVGGAAGGVAVAQDERTTGTIIGDKGIEFKIANTLADDRAMDDTHIDVTSMNGVVLLSGQVPTSELRTQAAEIAHKVPQVREVHNELAVGPNSSLSSRTQDTWITTKIVSKLLGAEGVSETRIKVVTEDGTVFLLGLVSRKQGDRAATVAQGVSGVRRIVKLFEYVG